MPLSKITSFTKKVTDLPDKPSPTYSASEIKDYILQPSNDLMSTVNGNVDALNNEFALKTELQNVVLGQIPTGTAGYFLRTSLDGTTTEWAQSLGINYYQTTEPTDYTQGTTWFNPDTGQLYVADGTKYQPIPPVQVLEEVIDFTETGITLTHSNTEVSNGSVQLLSEDNMVSRPADVSSTNVTNKSGIRIHTNRDLSNSDVIFTLSSNTSGATKAYLYQSTTLLETITLTGNTFQFAYAMQNGNEYDILVDNEGVSYTRGEVSATFPINSADVNLIGGLYDVNSTNSTAFSVLSVQTITKQTTGSTIIQWDTQPSDLKAWDLATYALTLAGETVTVDVESSSDGSTWTTEFTDIDQNFDISTIDPSKQVRLKANLSRVDTNNNPTCDYVARRFVR